MPFAVSGAAIGSVLAPIAGSVAGSLVSGALAPGTSGGSGGGGGGPSYYIPTGLTSADQAWQNLLTNNQGSQQAIQGALPYYFQSLDQGLGAAASYAPGLQLEANNASTGYGNLAARLGAASGQQFGGAQNVYQTAFDPQSALYNRTVQQLQDQTGATNSMYGLGSSAAGAGVANQALSNFNIDWQNQQLQRQIQGLQAAGQAYGQAGALGQAGAQSSLLAGQTPYQAALGIAAAPGQLAGQFASGIEQGPISATSGLQSQIIPYLNYGQGAQSIPYQSQQAGAGAAGALASQGIGGFFNNPQVQNSLGNAFSNVFNPASGSFSGGDFSGAFTSSPYYSGGGNSYGFTLQ